MMYTGIYAVWSVSGTGCFSLFRLLKKLPNVPNGGQHFNSGGRVAGGLGTYRWQSVPYKVHASTTTTLHATQGLTQGTDAGFPLA